eukprot:Skav227370  [mRNA]  locus=scaffold2373:120941:128041:+ [translate_table: standard]
MAKKSAKPNSAAGKRKGASKTGAANRGKKAGQGAVRAGSALKHSNASSKPGRTTPKGETRVRKAGSHMRSESTIKRLQMYNKKPDRKRMKEQSLKPVRIQPDRRWFGNTRVIAQEKMQQFRDAWLHGSSENTWGMLTQETIAKGVEDPFSVVLKSSKLPMSLLRDTESKSSRMDLLSVSPYQEVFSKKRQQKRAKIGANDLEGLREAGWKAAEKAAEGYGEGHAAEEIFNKGTSRRIWGELYKVVDASDVLVFVLDARDPNGTRCVQLERDLRKRQKHVVLLLNKVDLVPTWVTRRWVQELMKEFPTLAFHASITNPFGKNSLLNLLRQFGNLLKDPIDKKHVTIGMVGYPNVGTMALTEPSCTCRSRKSSVINTLKRKAVCKAAPVPGETRVWQYIALTRTIGMGTSGVDLRLSSGELVVDDG